MSTSRRTFVKASAALLGTMPYGVPSAEVLKPRSEGRFFRIATEEAMAIPELFDEYRILFEQGDESEPFFLETAGAYARFPFITERMTNLGKLRIAEMDAAGVNMQLLSVLSPGVQVLDARKGTMLAKKVNDRIHEAVRAHPERFVGLAALAPQDPHAAAQEMERAVQKLGLKGAMINSHTKGEYLDDRKFWGIFEVAQALDVPIYLHPREPSPQMIKPYLDHGLAIAGWGFAAETGLHAMRLIMSGVFDEFPRLKIVLGHLGEMIPYWLPRIDTLAFTGKWAPDGPVQKTRRLPSEYFKEHFFVTTSGASNKNWHPTLMMAYEVLGADRILFAVDYPFESGQDAVSVLDSAPIPDSEKAKIYHLNAERLFKIERNGN